MRRYALGCLNVCNLSDPGLHYRLRLWRADDLTALRVLLRLAHTAGKPMRVG